MIDLPHMSPPQKRSITIAGHHTSVSLEEPFWQELGAIAKSRDLTRAALIGLIDQSRPQDTGLATALRLFVLDQVMARLK